MQSQVLIAGAGPVGMTMAIELARYQIPLRIIDKSPQRTDKSKALVIWSRTLELLERAGCSRALVDAGYKVTSVNITAGKEVIAHFTLDGAPTAYPYGLMLPQSETERILDEHLNKLGIIIERNVELSNFTTSANRVTSTLRHSDGREETHESSWLIGCDGAHSAVRHQLGMEFLGDTILTDWVLADIHIEGLPRTPQVEIAWHSDGLVALFPIAEDRYRIIADSGASDLSKPPSDPTLADVQGILGRRLPRGLRASDPVWLSAFRINERKVADYRSGRVFLAGDAAHVHSPAGGQGMNTGMQDACNLAWKLALVSRGICSENPLLDSYSVERSAIGKQVLAATGRVTSIALATGEVKQALRNRIATLVLGLSFVRKKAADIVTEISLGYHDSPLNAHDGRFHEAPAPGERAPIRAGEPPVGAGATPLFALFAAGPMPPEFESRYTNLIDPFLRKPFHNDGLWLVRPDGYAALATKAGNWHEVSSYLDRISGSRQS